MSGGRGLFLDLDGTLADSLAAMRGVYDDFLREHDATGSDAEFDRLNGPPLAEVVAMLRTTHRLAPPLDALVRRYREMVAAAQTSVAPAPGAAELLRHARARGYRVAVVSSGDRAGVLRWLAHTGLDRFVDAVVGGDEVERGKPDPAPYRLALARLGTPAAASLAIEDSPSGARAAIAAGLPACVLTPAAAAAVRSSPLFQAEVPSLAAAAAHLI